MEQSMLNMNPWGITGILTRQEVLRRTRALGVWDGVQQGAPLGYPACPWISRRVYQVPNRRM